jgi:hypothetical protein
VEYCLLLTDTVLYIVEPPAPTEVFPRKEMPKIFIDVIDEMRFIHASTTLLSLSAPYATVPWYSCTQTAHHRRRLLDIKKRNFFGIQTTYQAMLYGACFGNTLPHCGEYVVTSASTITKQDNSRPTNDSRSSIMRSRSSRLQSPCSVWYIPLLLSKIVVI